MKENRLVENIVAKLEQRLRPLICPKYPNNHGGSNCNQRDCPACGDFYRHDYSDFNAGIEEAIKTIREL